MRIGKISARIRIILLLSSCFFLSFKAICQAHDLYPPYTKWYQDPLGLKPLQLSTAFGFVWSSTSIAACLVFTKNDSAFQKKFKIYADQGMSFGYKYPFTLVAETDAGMMYDIRKWMAVGLEWNVFHFKDKIDDTYCFGLRPSARFHTYGEKIKIFFEYGAGVSYSLKIFPLTGIGKGADTARIGTKFNLTSKYCVGLEFPINKKISTQCGARHFHLSNGNIKGIGRNPSHDSNGFFVGLFYKIFP